MDSSTGRYKSWQGGSPVLTPLFFSLCQLDSEAGWLFVSAVCASVCAISPSTRRAVQCERSLQLSLSEGLSGCLLSQADGLSVWGACPAGKGRQGSEQQRDTGPASTGALAHRGHMGPSGRAAGLTEGAGQVGRPTLSILTSCSRAAAAAQDYKALQALGHSHTEDIWALLGEQQVSLRELGRCAGPHEPTHTTPHTSSPLAAHEPTHILTSCSTRAHTFLLLHTSPH